MDAERRTLFRRPPKFGFAVPARDECVSDHESTLPALIATVMIVSSLNLQGGRKQALGLAAANFAGGVASLALVIMLVLNPSLATFALLSIPRG